jgi:hypothetical protein
MGNSAADAGISSNEYCPNCGKDVAYLNDFTGWCADCTESEYGSDPTIVGSSANTSSTAYLEANADTLEHYITTGQASNVHQAIDILADPRNGHRPTCVVCGSVIKHAPRTSVFCRKNKECRRMSRRYIYLYTEKGMTKAQAFATIMQELGME